MDDTQQAQLNINVQERLRALEAQQQIMTSLLVAIISTHPDRDALKKSFESGCEALVSRWLASQLNEDWIDQGVGYRDLLLTYFDQPIPTSR